MMTASEFAEAVIEAMRRPVSEEEAVAYGAQCAADLGAVYRDRVEAIIDDYLATAERGRLLKRIADGLDIDPEIVRGYDEDANRDYAEEAYNQWLMNGGDA